MTVTSIDVTTIQALTHAEGMSLQAGELDRTLSLLRSLNDTEWATVTDCPGWDIRAMYQHVLGACEAGAAMRENIHQLRRARAYRKANGGPLEAALSGVQVRERADMGPVQIVERMAAIAPKTLGGRTRTPAIMRNHFRMAIDGPVHETWKLGYLIDTIYLRDLWMHRIDVGHALSHPVELSPDHDGRIVVDVVSEWARRHGQPFMLELSGPAGGTFIHHPDLPEAERLTLDAVEFCRILAGRGHPTGLLSTVVPF
jgi:uncharacterized protein (TIGR03083 family)